MSKNSSHDGRELELLLSAQKPLAAFSFYSGAREKDVFFGQEFDVAVKSGKILRFDKCFEFENQSVKYVVFVLPEEVWRAHAYFHIKRFMFQRDWCAHLEWIEGSLLGYSDVENRAHILKKYGPKGPKLSCKGV